MSANHTDSSASEKAISRSLPRPRVRLSQETLSLAAPICSTASPFPSECWTSAYRAGTPVLPIFPDSVRSSHPRDKRDVATYVFKRPLTTPASGPSPQGVSTSALRPGQLLSLRRDPKHDGVLIGSLHEPSGSSQQIVLFPSTHNVVNRPNGVCLIDFNQFAAKPSDR